MLLRAYLFYTALALATGCSTDAVLAELEQLVRDCGAVGRC